MLIYGLVAVTVCQRYRPRRGCVSPPTMNRYMCSRNAAPLVSTRLRLQGAAVRPSSGANILLRRQTQRGARSGFKWASGSAHHSAAAPFHAKAF